MSKRPKKNLKTVSFNMRAAPDEVAAWKAAAKANDRTLSNWLRWLANTAVSK